jgi:RNA polymerase sigma-70 factor, ECF subfamily
MTETGNKADLEALWGRFADRLHAFILSRVDDPQEAEDLLQEVFLRVHHNLCCLPAPEKLQPWIYQITRNQIIDHYRKRRAVEELPDDLAEEDSLLLTEEDRGAALALSLQEMIEQLPEPYRQALLLAEIEGKSQKEIAERLDISYSGVKSRVQRARKKLLDLLLACCHFELDQGGRIIDYYARCCCCEPEGQEKSS